MTAKLHTDSETNALIAAAVSECRKIMSLEFARFSHHPDYHFICDVSAAADKKMQALDACQAQADKIAQAKIDGVVDGNIHAFEAVLTAMGAPIPKHAIGLDDVKEALAARDAALRREYDDYVEKMAERLNDSWRKQLAEAELRVAAEWMQKSQKSIDEASRDNAGLREALRSAALERHQHIACITIEVTGGVSQCAMNSFDKCEYPPCVKARALLGEKP